MHADTPALLLEAADVARDEVIYANDQTRVVRGRAEGQPVVLKHATVLAATRRLTHEAAVLKRLAGLAGVVKMLGFDAGAHVLTLADAGDCNVAELMRRRRLAPAEVVTLGIGIARILSGVHAAGVVHRDLCPSNLMVDPQTLAPTLIDFNIALVGGTDAEGRASEGGIAGTLAYMSPEHTGRTSHPVEVRSDLYSLGCTLYELLTGHKPFESEDLLELVHDHLVTVPTPPSTVDATVPPLLSDIVMRLLEKEPDRRYQSAEGLALDLERLQRGLAAGSVESFELGRFDFGPVLRPPAHPVGREAEIATLREAVAAMAEGRTPWLVVSEVEGCRASALLDELRPMAAAARAWFTGGKFAPAHATHPVAALDGFRGIGRQLLALPAEPLAALRDDLLVALDGYRGFGIAQLPELQMLLGEHPAEPLGEDGDARLVEAAMRFLRCLSRAKRPVVIVGDQVQHAPALLMQLCEALAAEAAREPLPGVLFVSACSADTLTPAHPVGQAVQRCSAAGHGPRRLMVGPLAAPAAAQLVSTVLRMEAGDAASLAASLERHTGHRPGRILECLNAIRRDAVLRPGEGRWQWEPDAVRRYVGAASPAELQARATALPVNALRIVRAMAALGTAVSWHDLAAAVGEDEAAVRTHAAAAVDDGLLVAQEGDRVAPAHERVGPAVLGLLGEAERLALHLLLGRRLDAVGGPASVIAAQYLAAHEVLEPGERRHAADLLEDEATRCREAGQTEAWQNYLAAAITLRIAAGDPADAERIFDLRIRQLQALYELGRHAGVDAAYAALLETAPDPERLAAPLRFQSYSLISRGQMVKATSIGIDLLGRLGIPKPEDIRPDLGAGIQRLAQWIRSEEMPRDIDRPVISDPRALVWAEVLPETMTAAYFADPAVWAWLGMQTHRVWVDYGPHPRLLSAVGSLPFVLVGAPQDYRGAHILGRHMLNVGEARGFVQGTELSRCAFAIAAAHWVDPLERVLEEFRHARRELLRRTEPFVSFTYVACDVVFDCMPTLNEAQPEIEAALAFAQDQGNQDFLQRYRPRQQIYHALRGETKAPGSFSDEGFDEEQYVAKLDPTGANAATYHMVRSIGAAIFGDMATLALHTAKGVPLSARTPGYYLGAIVRVLRSLSLTVQIRAAADEAARAPLVEELNGLLKWITARAGDAPENFLHLQRWIEAERAWALDTVWAAGAAFQAAVTESLAHARPWHRAIIHERAGLFHLAQGMEHTGRPLLTAACEGYEAWGAAGKVKEMKRQHAFLRAASRLGHGGASPRSTVVDTEVVDMMAVLRASQALSSETNLARLTTQVGKVLEAIAGATGAQLVVHPEEGSSAWVTAVSLGAGQPVSVEEAGARGELPLSAFRYAERTKTLLVVDDATSDERFSADPYVEKFAQCSLVLAPIVQQGQLHAMLILENDQRRAAFSAERLNSVSMIAGQLAVSLDNALLYASLEKRVAERTAQLRQKTADINAMLQNMPQGVLTIVDGGVIHPEYSAYLETILETQDIVDRPAMALLFDGASLGPDALSQIDAAIGSCLGEDAMNFEFNAHLLPAEFDKATPDGRTKSLALTWSPITDDEDVVRKLMLCVRDVTELKRLEAEADARKRELQMIGEILAVTQEKFHEFIDGARGFVAENRQLIEGTGDKQRDVIERLFRNMHTIKGNARTHGLLGLTNLVHVAEQAYDELRQSDEGAWDAAALLGQLDAVGTLLERYAHVNEVVLGRKGPGRRAGVEKFVMVERDTVQQTLQMLMALDDRDPAALREALRSVGRTLHLLGTETLDDALASATGSLQSLARELGKEPPQVRIESHGLVVRRQASGMLRNVFMHLLRNALDHGIEPPEVRRAQGKPAAGRIDIQMTLEHERLRIHLRDDGRGLPIERIREKAAAAGLVGADEPMTPEAIAQLVFRSGLSTAERVTEVSGRGVGMDAVKAFVEKEGGSIELRLLAGMPDHGFRPFETVISLPEQYAASLDAAMSFDALCARLRATAAAAALKH